MSGTLVVLLAADAGQRLYKGLGHGAFSFRPVDHAHWAASGEDVSVVYYRSGKLVVQGKGTADFAERHREILGQAARVAPAGAKRPVLAATPRVASTHRPRAGACKVCVTAFRPSRSLMS